MQNKKLIILIVLGVTAIFSLLYGITANPKGRKNLPSKQGIIHQGEKIESEKRIEPRKRRAKKTKFSSGARNPFSPRGSFLAASGLSGILWDKESPKAIINNNIVGIGDKVDGNTLVDIRQDRVILNDGTKNFELLLER